MKRRRLPARPNGLRREAFVDLVVLPAVAIGGVYLIGRWLFGSSQAAASASASPLLVIGDSQACGATNVAHPCGEIPGDPSCAKSGSTFATTTTIAGRAARVFCTVGARTSAFTAARMAMVAPQPNETVLVFLGSNDCGAHPDPSAIVSAVDAVGAKLLWVGPPAIRGVSCAAADSLAASLGPRFFDSRALSLQQADGVHPTPAEFARWMAAVLQAADASPS